MTNQPIINEDGSVNLKLLRTETGRLKKQRSEHAHFEFIDTQIKRLNDSLDHYNSFYTNHFIERVKAIENLSMMSASNSQKAIFEYLNQFDSIYWSEMKRSTVITIMELVVKAVESGAIQFDKEELEFYRTGTIAPSVIKQQKELEKANSNKFSTRIRKLFNRIFKRK